MFKIIQTIYLDISCKNDKSHGIVISMQGYLGACGKHNVEFLFFTTAARTTLKLLFPTKA